MHIIKGSIRYLAVFVLTVVLLMGTLVCSALIPQNAIKENVRKSAEFLCEGELFAPMISGVQGSKIDRYADSILLAIAYQYDSEKPLESVMRSAYYYTMYQNENDNLLDAVSRGYGPNQQYMRYWHGSIALVRPLLLVFSIRQIYVMNGLLILGLVVWLLGLLWRNRAIAPMIGLSMGLVATNVWFVPLSLEYTWTYVLMLIMSILCVKQMQDQKENGLGICFLLAGMLTNYMDFLTTETLTLTVPVLLVIWMKLKQKEANPFEDVVKRTCEYVCVWGVGYVGMWLMKWCLAAIVLRENVLPYVTGHIRERLGVEEKISVIGTLWRNIKCLFPIEYGEIGFLIAVAMVLLIVYVGYVYRRKEILVTQLCLYGIMGLIPYIRYLVLLNHSFYHHFFTYRAQLSAIFSIVLVLDTVVEWKWLFGKKRRLKM